MLSNGGLWLLLDMEINLMFLNQILNVVLVLYCILLAAAQSDKERLEIEDRMRAQPELSEILHQLSEQEPEDMMQVIYANYAN